MITGTLIAMLFKFAPATAVVMTGWATTEIAVRHLKGGRRNAKNKDA